MDLEQKLQVIRKFVECYRERREKHMRSSWLKVISVWSRIYGKGPAFDKLRNTDMAFFRNEHNQLRIGLQDNGFSKKEIGEMALYLKNHRSIVAESDLFLIVYFTIVGVIYLVPRNNWNSWLLVGVAAITGLVVTIMRGNMKRHDSICNEIVELLQHEAKEG